MKHFIIGTAGHVDHGKTVLVRALTGIDTDRLKEEKERGISIELGFAPFKLPNGTLAGVVDVPGHERFIKNMLAGVGGIDMVLLVVAADEGIMPQTREHLEIIDLLQIPEGIIVITKIDLVEEDWLELVSEEVRELVRGTVLENAPVAGVSAVTGQGLPELIELVQQVSEKLSDRPTTGQARMPIDRVFTVTGFGTVVTGTLVEGNLRVGDMVQIMPRQREGRVRGLQVHGQKVEAAEPGQRVAVNVAGIEHEQIERGSVLALPKAIVLSHRLDIRLKLLPSAAKPLVNRARVRVHLGTAEILARVVLLEGDELEPGNSGFAQLECEEPLAAARGDRLVLRSYSPMRTIGGGKVIDPSPPKRKRLNPEVIENLRTKEKGTPEELLKQLMINPKQLLFTGAELVKGLGTDEDVAMSSLENLVALGDVRLLKSDSKTYYILSAVFEQKAGDLKNTLENYHRQYPLRPGISKEEIRSRHFSGLTSKLFNVLMELYQAEGIAAIVGENAALAGFSPAPGPALEKTFQAIEEKYVTGDYQTPGWDEITVQYKLSPAQAEEILGYFVNSSILVKLEDNVLVSRKNLDRAKELVMEFLRQNKEMSLGEARDLLKTSRKFALPIMSYLDQERITRRVDDKRVLY